MISIESNNHSDAQPAKLFHIHDPMCSWCWGFKPTLELLKAQLPPEVTFVNIVGGLAADSQEPMSNEMKQYLQQTWKTIASQLGTTFNHNYWDENTPIRSTYPACRAVLVAKEYDKEQAMINAIQAGYYLHCKNPSLTEQLAEFANDIDITRSIFLDRLQSPEIEQALQQDINTSQQLQAQGFPSLRLVKNNQLHAITLDYKNAEAMLTEIVEILQG